MNKEASDFGLVDGDKIRVILSTGEFSANPVSTKFLVVQSSGFKAEDVINLLKAIEYKKVLIADVEFSVTTVKVPNRTGRSALCKPNMKTKLSVVTIKNTDSTCMARAFVTAIAILQKHKWTTSQLNDGFKKSRKLERTEAEKLHFEADVPIHPFGNTLEDLNKFSEHLCCEVT